MKKILTVLAVIIGYLLFYIVTKLIAKKVTTKTNKISVSFGFQAAQALACILSVVYICTRFEATEKLYTTILTNMSLIVVVLGFAAQESIRNVLSGIMIINSKPFAIGQRIAIPDHNITGTIQNITLRHTIIRKFNNTTIIVPNSIMNAAIIENSSYGGDERISNFLDLQVAYESDIDAAMIIVDRVIREHPNFIKDKNPGVSVRNLGAEGYDVRATVWTTSISANFQACSDIRIKIKKEFDKAGIEIPYNHINLLRS